MANTRELSQLASVISVADETRNVGIGTTTPTSKLHVSGDVRISGILTVGTSSLTLNGTDNIVLVGSATTIDTTGFKIGGSFLHSSGLNLGSGNINSHNINSTGIITSTGGFVGNVVGVATGLLFGNSSIFIANESIKFVVNNSLIATISTTGIFSVVDLNMGLKNITNLAEPSAASDASTKNYADTGSSDFPIGDYGGFTSGDTDSFGQVISDFTSYDLLNNPSGSLQTEDFGVLT